MKMVQSIHRGVLMVIVALSLNASDTLITPLSDALFAAGESTSRSEASGVTPLFIPVTLEGVQRHIRQVIKAVIDKPTVEYRSINAR
jgi:hypothetical protein